MYRCQWSVVDCIRMLSSSLHRAREVCFGQREKFYQASFLTLLSLPLALPRMTGACFSHVKGLTARLCSCASHVGVISEFTQRRRRRLRKRHLKVNLRCLKLHRAYSVSFHSSNVGKFFGVEF